MSTYQNPTKNDEKLKRLLKRLEQDYVRGVAESFANSNIDECLEWLSRPKNKRNLAASLRYVHVHLPKLLFVLEDLDGRRLPSVLEIKDEDHCWRGSVVRYLVEFGQLRWLADYVLALPFRKKSYAKIFCAKELTQFFRDNLGRPCNKEVGEILSKKFPEQASKQDFATWVRQIVNRPVL